MIEDFGKVVFVGFWTVVLVSWLINALNDRRR